MIWDHPTSYPTSYPNKLPHSYPTVNESNYCNKR